MKLRWKIILGMVVVAAIGTIFLAAAPNRAQRDLERTRRSLRQEGFKIDLPEFDLSTSPELRARAAILGATTRVAMTNRSRPGPMLMDIPPFHHSCWKQYSPGCLEIG
jgi:hypothetical protein